MKKTALTLAMGLLVSGAANAAVEANIGATSNYVWRGVTQTSDDATLQGGVDYSNEEGFSLGAWASDVKFADGYELDIYGGYSAESASGIGYSVGFTQYLYPDAATDIDFLEIYGSVSVGPVTAAIAHTISADTASSEGDNYYSLSAGTDLEEGLSLGGTLGYYDYDSGASYTHAQLDLTKSLGDYGDVTASLSKLNNDGTSNDEGTLFFVSYSKTF
jgi:uncharacterized protein (TIGR02001 family)